MTEQAVYGGKYALGGVDAMLSNEVLISVIVPIYNTKEYLKKCVQSILNQTHKNLEIILVDDGSTDGSGKICDEYVSLDDRVKVIHKCNGGLSSARNAGLDACNGSFIGFVDSDDWIAETMYETLLSQSMPQKSIVTVGMAETAASGNTVNRSVWDNKVISCETLFRRILFHEDGGSVCSRLFSRDVIGDFRFDERKLNEDVLFMSSVIPSATYIADVSIIGYFCFRREGSISRQFGKAIHDMVGNSIQIRKQISEKYPNLINAAGRFEIIQHMKFLLCCPSDYARAEDPLYGEVLTYVRKHMLNGIMNPCLTNKERLKLIGVAFAPVIMSKLVEKKKGKKQLR